VTVGLAAQSAKAFQGVGDEQIRLDFGGTRERVVGVAFGLFGLPLRILNTFSMGCPYLDSFQNDPPSKPQSLPLTPIHASPPTGIRGPLSAGSEAVGSELQPPDLEFLLLVSRLVGHREPVCRCSTPTMLRALPAAQQTNLR